MPTQHVNLVQGDTAPSLYFSITDERTGAPVDLTGAAAVMHFRAVGATSVLESIPCTVIPGIELDDGDGGFSVSLAAPYNVPGPGGRLQLDWTTTALDGAGEFEGEVQITFPNGRQQTVLRTVSFSVREQFA